jgi:hypothetical protein
MRRIVDMRGLPPPRLLRRGKSTHKLFVRTAPNFDYRLKTASEYTLSTGIELAPPKRYLKHDTLHDLVTKYPMKRSLTPDEIANEEQQRVAFLHFLQGLLNVDPVRRWTATQAAQHPFVLNEPLPEGGWKPAAPPAIQDGRQGRGWWRPTDNAGAPPLAGTMTAAEAAAHVSGHHDAAGHGCGDDDCQASADRRVRQQLRRCRQVLRLLLLLRLLLRLCRWWPLPPPLPTVAVKSEAEAGGRADQANRLLLRWPRRRRRRACRRRPKLHAEMLKRERSLTTPQRPPVVVTSGVDAAGGALARHRLEAADRQPCAALGANADARRWRRRRRLPQSFVAPPYVPHPQLGALGSAAGRRAAGLLLVASPACLFRRVRARGVVVSACRCR